MSFKYIDLFAGIGGMRIPFDELGGTCIFSSEIDNHARKAYSDNYGELPHGDITEISPKDIPKHDLLLAGFPCQPFSQAGLKKGFEDTRGTLFFYIANIIKEHLPKVVLLENVKRFRTHDKGNTFLTVKNTLNDLGYTVFSEVLNAKNYGVPQNRERIFIIALRGKHESFTFPKPIQNKTCVGNILEKNVDPKYTISDRLWAGHKRRKKEHQEKGYGFGYSLFDEKSEYTSTISARYYKDGSEILIDQGKENPRKVTPREASRLQGFPSWFNITVSDTQAYKQFGNSVSVPVIRAIAQQLEAYLNGSIKFDNIAHTKQKALHIPIDGVVLPS